MTSLAQTGLRAGCSRRWPRAKLGGVDSQRQRECLDAEFHRFRAVAGAADLDAPVPSCPDWKLVDLVRHVGEVYLYKVEQMRLGRHADEWPPEGMNEEPALELLDRAFSALAAEFDARRPRDRVFTWYEPDQTVGFWIRDMANETVLHRVDAELAAGRPVTAIPDDLANDGIDELLVAFVQYDVMLAPDKVAGLLAAVSESTVRVVTPQRSWLVRMAAGSMRVDEPGVTSATASIEGSAPDVLLWLWNRDDQNIMTDGNDAAVALLRNVVDTVLGARVAS
jgi:uncharacterized protein (TIGR03083 family)